MKKRNAKWAAVLAVCLAFSAKAKAGWDPVFVDNFNGPQLNYSKWETAGTMVDGRSMHFSPKAAQMRNGVLALTVLDLPLANRPYAAGGLNTRATFDATYGYFEIRAKMPRGQGLWPAFWLMPMNGTWSHEIDILETLGRAPTSLNMAFHYDYNHRPENTKVQDFGALDLTDGFHTYGLLWEPGKLSYYFDGKKVHEVISEKVPNEPMFVILNNAVANHVNQWIREPESAMLIDPAFQVDYVRVFQQNPNGGRYVGIPSPEDFVADSTAKVVPESPFTISLQLAENQEKYRRLEPGTHSLTFPAVVKNYSSLSQNGSVTLRVQKLTFFGKSLEWVNVASAKLPYSVEPEASVTLPFQITLSETKSTAYRVLLEGRDAKNQIIDKNNYGTGFEILNPADKGLVLRARADGFQFIKNADGSKLAVKGKIKLMEAFGVSDVNVKVMNGAETLFTKTFRKNDLDTIFLDEELPLAAPMAAGTAITLKVTDGTGTLVGWNEKTGAVLAAGSRAQQSLFYRTKIVLDGDANSTRIITQFTCPANLDPNLRVNVAYKFFSHNRTISPNDDEFIKRETLTNLTVAQADGLCQTEGRIPAAYHSPDGYEVLTSATYKENDGRAVDLFAGEGDRVGIADEVPAAPNYNGTIYVKLSEIPAESGLAKVEIAEAGQFVRVRFHYLEGQLNTDKLSVAIKFTAGKPRVAIARLDDDRAQLTRVGPYTYEALVKATNLDPVVRQQPTVIVVNAWNKWGGNNEKVLYGQMPEGILK